MPQRSKVQGSRAANAWSRGVRAGLACLIGAGTAVGCERRAAGPFEPLQVTPAPPPAGQAQSAKSAGLRLDARLEYPAGLGGEPTAVLARDLDGDGRAELVGQTRSPGSLQVSSGYSPTSCLVPEARSYTSDDWPVGPVWVEAQSPSPSTLVAFSPRDPPSLVVLDAAVLWRGGDEPVRWRTPLERRARVVAAGDLGRDGTPEVLLVTVDDDLLVFQGPETPRKLRLCDPHATCLWVLGSGEGFLVGFQGTRRVVLYQATKSNPFGFEPGPALELPGLPRKLLACDFDGDGDEELAIALGDDRLWILGAKRAGGVPAAFAAAPLELRVGTVPIDLAACELDGQPGSEIVCLSLAGQDYAAVGWDQGRLRWLAREYAGQSPAALACADFDGDGRVDLALANSGAKRWSVCFGTAAGGFAHAERARSGRSPHSLAVGDLDGDGQADLAVLNALEGMLSILPGTKDGLGPARKLIRAASADDLCLADADGDGKLDALWLALQEGERALVIAFGDGKGNVWERASTPPQPLARGKGGLCVADLDGDGVVELLASDPERDLVTLHVRSTGPGQDPRFAKAAELALASAPGPLQLLDGAPRAWRLAVGLAGSNGRKGCAVLDVARDAGGAWKLSEAAFVETPASVRALDGADLDGDGDRDLALLVAPEGSDGVGGVLALLQDAPDRWSANRPQFTGARPYQIAAGDLDGDGRAEILVSSQNGHHLNLWFASGSGALEFRRGPDLGVGTGPLALRLVDLDGDGVREILCTNAFSDDVSVIRTR